MLLTISTTFEPASDLGYLLHKNPARFQSFNLNFGTAHVFYSKNAPERCTANLLIDIDPVGLVRNRRGPSGEGFSLEQYVNDRPYAANSFLSVAISQVLGSALAGASRERPELAAKAIPLEAVVSVLPCKAGESFIQKLFEPLGYDVRCTHHPLDESFPEWGEGNYYTLQLKKIATVSELLTHLYVLVPVLDNDKHYWIGKDEVEKLLRHGETWLANHPQKEQIVRRYLGHRRDLANDALSRLIEADPEVLEAAAERHATEEEQVEKKISLNEQRLATVLDALHKSGARSVLDLGCSYGNLLRRLLADKQFDRIVGLDVSHRALQIAADRLSLDRMHEKQRSRIELMHGSLNYRDSRVSGFDAAAVVEVIEHLDEPRLATFERVLFEFARPTTVIVTTPNFEYNVRFDTLPAGQFRHRDHRFEWTRMQFQNWASSVGNHNGYAVAFVPVGIDDPEVGPATQMAVFSR